MRPESVAPIDEFFSSGKIWTLLTRRVKGDLPGIGEQVAEAIQLALNYMLTSRSRDAWRPGYGPYVPVFEFDDWIVAPPLDRVPARIVTEWVELAGACSSPAAVARFTDLLWLLRHQPRPDLRARAAIAAYLELTAWPPAVDGAPADRRPGMTWANPVHTAVCYIRALQISLDLGDSELTEECVTKIVLAIENCLNTKAEAPGFFDLVSSLVDLPASARPPQLPNLLDDAIASFGGPDNTHNHLALTEMRVQLTSDRSISR